MDAFTVTGIQNYSALTRVTTWWIDSLAQLSILVVLGTLAYARGMRANRPTHCAELGKTHI
ncbi:hypothetical protein [Actinomadura sp. 9N407]|uniref:hypothetical protein n=1 Tax=Actinomadura sp. 9N407 TaxID=3375154 RepID=UPI00379C8D65